MWNLERKYIGQDCVLHQENRKFQRRGRLEFQQKRTIPDRADHKLLELSLWGPILEQNQYTNPRPD